MKLKSLIVAIFMLIGGWLPAFAEHAVQMRDADLVLNDDQIYITTLNVFSAPRTLTIPSVSELTGQYIQFIDTANAISSVNTLTIKSPPGELINGSSSIQLNTPGSYVVIFPSSSGYLAKVLTENGGGGGGGGTGTVTNITAGTGLATSPAAGISSSGSISLAPVADGTMMVNISGGDAAPASQSIGSFLDAVFSPNVNNIAVRGTMGWNGTSLSNYLDGLYGTSAGAILYRNATTWSALPAGTFGQALTIGGANLPAWQNLPSGVPTLGGLQLYANPTTGTAAAQGVSLTAYLDSVLTSNVGAIPMRNSNVWGALLPGTNGQVLTMVSGTPTWAAASLPSIAPGNVLGNSTGTFAPAASSSIFAIMGQACGTAGNTQGASLMYQNDAWVCGLSDYVDPFWFGADPSGNIDSFAAFNNAIAAALDNGKLRITCGTYKISGTLSFNAANNVSVDGQGCVTLRFVPTNATSDFINIAGGTNLRDISLTWGGTAASSTAISRGTAVHFTGVADGVGRLSITGFQIGVLVDGASNSVNITDTTFTQSATGGLGGARGVVVNTSSPTQAVTIINSNFSMLLESVSGADNIAVAFDRCNGCNLNTSRITGGDKGLRIMPTGTSQSVAINASTTEISNTAIPVYIAAGSATAVPIDISLTDLLIYGNQTGIVLNSVTGSAGVRRLTINNCNCSNNGGYGLDLRSALDSNVRVNGGTYGLNATAQIHLGVGAAQIGFSLVGARVGPLQTGSTPGIRIETQCNGCTFTGNDLSGNGSPVSSAVSVPFDAATVISSNIGWAGYLTPSSSLTAGSFGDVDTSTNSYVIAQNIPSVLSAIGTSGLLVLNDNNTGSTAIYLLGGSSVVLVAQSIAGVWINGASPAANQIGVYYDTTALNYKIVSNRVGGNTYQRQVFRVARSN